VAKLDQAEEAKAMGQGKVLVLGASLLLLDEAEGEGGK